jgi:hypothetical protein
MMRLVLKGTAAERRNVEEGVAHVRWIVILMGFCKRVVGGGRTESGITGHQLYVRAKAFRTGERREVVVQDIDKCYCRGAQV